MLTENVLYEGLIHGLNEYHYRKLVKHLRNAFQEVDYEYHGKTGTLLLNGPSAMFAQDPENLSATLDLLVTQLEDDARGVILEKQWNLDGTVKISGYVIEGKSWRAGSLEL